MSSINTALESGVSISVISLRQCSLLTLKKICNKNSRFFVVLTPPLNVQLLPISAHEARLSWNYPVGIASEVKRYTIEWSKGGVEQTQIVLGNVSEYTFTGLMSSQSLSAGIRTVLRNGRTSPLSSYVQLSLPHENGG